MSSPRALFKQLQERFGIATFVETGTYLGDTAVWASDVFHSVITIERSPTLFEHAKRRYADRTNMTFLCGDAREQFARVVPQLTSPALFWLDAHWSGGETAGAEDECPLVAELEAINASGLSHFIFIDDAKLFLAPPPPPHQVEQWPSIDEVASLLQTPQQRRYVAVSDDIIMAVPEEAKALLVEYLRSYRKPLLSSLPFAASATRALSRLRYALWLRREGGAVNSRS
jgi:hypothetical protein